jgi:hypothetical protein
MRVDYPVFAFEDTEPAPQRRVLPSREIDVLAAVWAVNRRAKRCRDLARNSYSGGRGGAAANFAAEKRDCYDLKGQALHYLREERRLVVVGYHAFAQPDGTHLWAEVLQGEGYTFHRPCANPQNTKSAMVLNEIEAKPHNWKDPKLKDALHTLKLYLANKPEAVVYTWPQRERPLRQARRAREDDEDEDDILNEL